MKNTSENIFIIAGETSGDIHASSLIREIKKLLPGTSFKGIGGPEMRSQGAETIYDIKEVNFIGFSSVVRNIKKIKAILDRCVNEVKRSVPEAVILVDYPGFNLKFIKSIRKFYKGKIIYYISPQLWAWHKSRVKTIREFVDLMLVVFPFEVDFYQKEDVDAKYVGHPLVKRVNDFLSKNEKTASDKKRICFLPGSRKDEIDRMLPVLVKAAVLFKKAYDCEINFLCSVNYEKDYFRKYINEKEFNIIYDKDDVFFNYKTMLNSELVITKSGTSTMECALIGTPFCVVYKAGKVNYMIGKNLVDVKYIAMVNILLDKKAVNEFLQNEMTPENIFAEGKKILDDKMYAERMKDDFKKLRSILTDKDASRNAAEAIVNFINN